MNKEISFPIERHESQRGYFAAVLYEEMARNPDIWLITADLGYKVFDYHFKDFPDRCINTGAAEQVAMGLSTGLALEGKIPVVYSITPFALWRPAEIIRNYINYEQIPVKIIGSGRDQDYAHDGWSHDGSDDRDLMRIWGNIQSYWPEDKNQIPELTRKILYNGLPSYMNLTR